MVPECCARLRGAAMPQKHGFSFDVNENSFTERLGAWKTNISNTWTAMNIMKSYRNTENMRFRADGRDQERNLILPPQVVYTELRSLCRTLLIVLMLSAVGIDAVDNLNMVCLKR